MAITIITDMMPEQQTTADATTRGARPPPLLRCCATPGAFRVSSNKGTPEQPCAVGRPTYNRAATISNREGGGPAGS